VSGTGDVNGDGLGDVVVTALGLDPDDPYTGRAYVVFGKADTAPVLLAEVALGDGGFAVDDESDEPHEDWSASGAGDVNGDGLADVLIGAPWAGPNAVEMAGRSYVVFGKADTDKVSLEDVEFGVGGFVVDGEAEADHSGRSVSSAGDVNGDALADIVVGAHWADPDGRSYVVFGKADTEAVLLADVSLGDGGFVLDGEAGGAASGYSVSGAGDVNGDGLADVIVGAIGGDPNGVHSGRTYVVFGKADSAPVLLADVAHGIGGFAMDGEGENDDSGWSVSGAGDVNGDGFADVVLGAPRVRPNDVADAGRTYVVFGGDFSCDGE